MAQSEGVKPVTYYPMLSWDTSPYKSFQYTTENGYWDWINFRLLYPNGYDSTAQTGEEYPLIVMLHGGGESGRMMWDNTKKMNTPYPKDDPRYDNNDHQLLFGGRDHLQAVKSGRFPGFVLFPQNFYGTWVKEDGGATYFHDDLRKTMELIEYLVEHLKIDPARIYIHGLSAGAKGTWLAAARRPDLFAAALPMSGHSKPEWAEQLAKVPLWVFQGEIDTNPRAWVTRETVEAVKAAGGEVRYTEYDSVGHNTWGRAYNEDDFFEWMLAHSKGNVTEVNEAPEIDAGPDKSLTLPKNSISLTATASDADGDALTYLWKQRGGPALTLKDSTSSTLALNNLVEGEYTFQVSVKDAEGAMDSDEVVLLVNPAENVAPTVTVGEDKEVELPVGSISFTASAKDTDGSIVSYLWEKTEGPEATLKNITTKTLTVSEFAEGSYTFKVTVKDDAGALASAEVGLIVKPKPNELPVVNAGENKSITLPADTAFFEAAASDPDGSIDTYSWKQLTGPESAQLSGISTARLSLSELTEGQYSFEITVADNKGATAKDTVALTVNPKPNEIPLITIEEPAPLTLPKDSTIISAEITDADGQIKSILWEKTEGPAAVLSGKTTRNLKLTGLEVGTYTFKVTATDNKGGVATENVSLVVNPAEDKAPVVEAGEKKEVTLPQSSVSFTATASDPEGTALTYLWRKEKGPKVILTDTTTKTLTVKDLSAGNYVFTILVTDEAGSSASDKVELSVLEAPNKAPVVNAGNDFKVVLPADSARIAADVKDPDGNIRTYLWTMLSGPSTPAMSGTTTAVLSLKGLVRGIYHFKITATDDDGAKASDSVRVLVELPPNQGPLVNAGQDQLITLPENTTIFTANGTDPDGTISTYFWEKLSGPSVTMGETGSEELLVSGLVEGSYVFQVTVTDNRGSTAKDQVQLIVEEAENIAPAVSAGNDVNITLPRNSTSLTATGTDTDGQVVSYLWQKVSGPAATMTNAGTAVLSLSDLTIGSYTFKVTATDEDGGTASDQVIVNVFEPEEENQGPLVNVGADTTLTTPVDYYVLEGSASDNDGEIVSYLWEQLSGPEVNMSRADTTHVEVVSLKPGEYVFRFTATDNDGARDSARVMITVNDRPVVDAGVDVNITLPDNTVSLQANASDTDGQIVSYLWEQVAGSAATMAGTGSAALSVSSLQAGSYTFQVTVKDNMGGVASDQVLVTVAEAPEENQGPFVEVGADTTLQLPVESFILKGEATDNDGEIVSYLWEKLSGPEVVMSRADTTHVELTGLEEGEYVFRFTATDNNGALDTADLKITVLPLVNAVDPGSVMASSIIAFPNPFTDFIKLKLKSVRSEKLLVSIFNVQMKEVYRGTIETPAGEEMVHRIQLQSGNLQPGTYYIRLRNENGTFKEMLLMVKH